MMGRTLVVAALAAAGVALGLSGVAQLQAREVRRRIRAVGNDRCFTGSKTITVRLTRGRWEYYCQPHETSMKGHFTVGAGAAAGTTTTDDHGGGSSGKG
jgi:plastocyanin